MRHGSRQGSDTTRARGPPATKGWWVVTTTELAPVNRLSQSSIAVVRDQVAMIQDLQKSVMIRDVDYGVIPGTQKPTLMKPGAEKLCMLFKLSTRVAIERRDMPNGHREYEIKVTLNRRDEDGEFFGEGVGMCSTMESKYRYRNSQRKCPACGKESVIAGKAEYGGGWMCWKKKGGCGSKWVAGAPEIESQKVGRVENPDIADTYNSVLKIAKKRSLVDAVLTATAASHIFTQDLEENHDPPSGEDPEPIGNGQHDDPLPPRDGSYQGPPPEEPQPKTITADQWKEVAANIKDYIGNDNYTKTFQAAILQHFGVERPGQLPASRWNEIVAASKDPKPLSDILWGWLAVELNKHAETPAARELLQSVFMHKFTGKLAGGKPSELPWKRWPELWAESINPERGPKTGEPATESQLARIDELSLKYKSRLKNGDIEAVMTEMMHKHGVSDPAKPTHAQANAVIAELEAEVPF